MKIGFRVCNAPNCSIQVPATYYMCANHWKKVPKEIQDEFYKVQKEYFDVIKKAVESISEDK